MKIKGARSSVLDCGDLRFTSNEFGDGPLILCLHGFPDTPASFGGLAPFLAAEGYRVVVVAMRGYEPASIPSDKRFGVDALADDPAHWVNALGEKKAHIIGHDWGATVAFAAVKKRPELFPSLTMMSVPHPARFAEALKNDRAQMARSSYVFFFQLRGLSEAWARWNDFAFLERLWSRWSPDWDEREHELEAVKAAMRKPGVLTAALSYYRASFDRSRANRDAAALLGGEIAIPTLGLCGEDDGCISADVFSAAMRKEDFPAGLAVHRIPGAGHFLHAEKPAAIASTITPFLAKIDA